MKIQKALEIAKDCNLTTAGEAVLNIQMHASSLFSVSDINKELTELKDTWNWIKKCRRTPDGKQPINDNTEIDLMLKHHIAEDLTDYKIYKQALKNPAFAKKLADE